MDDSQTSGYTGHGSGSKQQVIGLIDRLQPGFWDKAAPVLAAMNEGKQDIANGCLLTIQDGRLVADYDFAVKGVATARSGTNPFGRSGST